MAQIIYLPRTEEGRRTMKEALFMLKNCGPAPDGSKVSEVDWDRLAENVDAALAEAQGGRL